MESVTVLHLYLISGMRGSNRYSFKKMFFNVFSMHRNLLSISNVDSLRNEVGNTLISFPMTSPLSLYQLLHDQFPPRVHSATFILY